MRELNETNTPKRARGKGKKPAMTHVNLRIPTEVLEYYKTLPNHTGRMRDVLVQHMVDMTTT
jgi:uncharacterized protein (DUF4415 family)